MILLSNEQQRILHLLDLFKKVFQAAFQGEHGDAMRKIAAISQAALVPVPAHDFPPCAM